VRGKSWAHNFGGYNYLQYTLSILKAGLTEKDIEPVRLADQSTSAATFNAGRADVYSGSTVAVAEGIEAGKARILVNSDELDIPALNVFTARTDVLADPAKKEGIADFLDRVRKHWEWYAANTGAVEKILVEKVKQTPARARLTAQYQQAVFYRLDDELVRREQRIADVLLQAGVIPKKIDVKIEFNRDFNKSTVASN
jgi:sulfonate transport system substrate-binding protein